MEESIARFGICFQFASEHDFSKLIIQQHITTTNISLSLINATTSTVLTNSRTLTINTIFMIVTMIFLIIPNMALIVGVVKTSRPTITLSKALYIYVSCVDLSYAVLTSPYFLVIFLTSHMNCNNKSVGTAVSVIQMVLSVSTFVLISIIRNQKVRRPLALVKRSLVLAYLVVFLCISIGYGVLVFWVFSDMYTSHSMLASYMMLMFAFLFIETLLMIIFNGWTKITLRHNSNNNNRCPKKTRTTNSNLSEGDSMTIVVERRNRRAVVTLVWLSGVYVMCILPVALYYLWLFVALLDFYQDPMKVVTAYEKYPIVKSLLLLYSGLNAIVYIAKSPEIKKYYRKIFFGSREINIEDNEQKKLNEDQNKVRLQRVHKVKQQE